MTVIVVMVVMVNMVIMMAAMVNACGGAVVGGVHGGDGCDDDFYCMGMVDGDD